METVDCFMETYGTLVLESVEDGGQSRITRLDLSDELFLRLQSWDESLTHSEIKEFEGKKVRLTIEVVDYSVVTEPVGCQIFWIVMQGDRKMAVCTNKTDAYKIFDLLTNQE